MGGSDPIIRAEGEGERRWFFGGGLHTWKATSADTNGSFFVAEDQLVRGKMTPLHRHPQDELVYLIEGEILYVGNGVERRVGRGTTIVTPRGVPHAFTVVSEMARILFLQAPGDGDAFYRGASVPAGEGEGAVDFAKVAEEARRTGATEILGPPPFVGRDGR